MAFVNFFKLGKLAIFCSLWESSLAREVLQLKEKRPCFPEISCSQDRWEKNYAAKYREMMFLQLYITAISF
jgi:hypothetical protein